MNTPTIFEDLMVKRIDRIIDILRNRKESKMEKQPLKTVNEMITKIHSTAVEKGFWEASQNIGEKIALVHSELSEALEVFEEWDEKKSKKKKDFKYFHFGEELADAVIRIFDVAGYLNLEFNEDIITGHYKEHQRSFYAIPNEIAKIHKTISKALEEYRKQDKQMDIFAMHLELSCREINDLACSFNLNLNQSILMKMLKNKDRKKLHGKRF